eukprot:scaffold9936_cov156-Amphora_coffeaeformis.AAC.4
MGLSLLDGKVSVVKILPVEWYQGTIRLFDIGKELAVQEICCTQSNKPFRYPSILPLNSLPLEILGAKENDDESGIFPVGSLVCASSKSGNKPSLFKLVTKCTDDETGDESRQGASFSAEVVRRFLQSRTAEPATLEPVSLCELINILPPSSILATKLLSLQDNVRRDESFILSGKSGSGKTHTALILAAMSHFLSARQLVYLDCVATKSLRRMVDILDAIRTAVEETAALKAVLILDDLDELVTHDHFEASIGSGAQVQQPNWGEMEQSKLIRDHVRNLLQTIDDAPPIIITCQAADVVSSILCTRKGHANISLPVLGPNERSDLVLYRLNLHEGNSYGVSEESLRHVLATHDFEGVSGSYLPVDLTTLTARVEKSMNAQDWNPADLLETIGVELERFVPVNRDAASLENAGSKRTWDDVGGLFQAKQELLDAVFRPSNYRRIYEKSKVRLPRGILLLGPSGCGKSFVVPALANHCRLPLIMCRGPELLDRYIGGSEAKVRELFSRAFLAAPCILFLDEFDALAPKRGSDSTGVTDRVVNQLLTFLDGVEDFSASGTVYIVAATSRPDKIDPALLRPGRLENHVYVGIPECQEEMIDVITKTAKGYHLEPGTLDSFCSSYQWSGESLSPADVRAGFQIAHLLALRQRLGKNERSDEEILINKAILREGFSKIRPSLSAEDAAFFRKTRQRFQKRKSSMKEQEEAISSSRGPLRTALK